MDISERYCKKGQKHPKIQSKKAKIATFGVYVLEHARAASSYQPSNRVYSNRIERTE